MDMKLRDRNGVEVEIPNEYAKQVRGKYNRGVYTCIECDEDVIDFWKYTIAINSAYVGNVINWECPHCFTKQYSHFQAWQVRELINYKENPEMYD